MLIVPRLVLQVCRGDVRTDADLVVALERGRRAGLVLLHAVGPERELGLRDGDDPLAQVAACVLGFVERLERLLVLTLPRFLRCLRAVLRARRHVRHAGQVGRRVGEQPPTVARRDLDVPRRRPLDAIPSAQW
jgi:hypothetical protein